MRSRLKSPVFATFWSAVKSKWEKWHQEFLTYSEQVGEQIFRSPLHKSDIWKKCTYISGPGFRSEVISKLSHWFVADEQKYWHDLLNNRIEEAWQQRVLGELDKLTE